LNRCCSAIEGAIGVSPVDPSSVPQLDDADEFGLISNEETQGDEKRDEAINGDQTATTLSQLPIAYEEHKLQWPRRQEILNVPGYRLAEYVEQVVQHESPVHVDEVVRRIREAAGKGRAGRLIREALDRAIGIAVRQGTVEKRGKFLYQPGQSSFTVRDRSAFEQQCKRIEYIAPEEIEQAATEMLKASLAVERDDVAKPIANALGFQRVTEEMELAIRSHLKKAVLAGRFVLAGEKLKLPGLIK
jgi:nitrogen regulatory protein PII